MLIVTQDFTRLHQKQFNLTHIISVIKLDPYGLDIICDLKRNQIVSWSVLQDNSALRKLD